MSILSGLSNLGLGDLEDLKVYDDNNIKGKVSPEEKEKTVDEIDFLLAKEYECPVCNAKFKQMVLRSNKARMIGQDMDLRPHYNYIDVTKYDVIMCPHCGYAALLRYFGPLPKPHRELIKTNISSKFKETEEPKGIISYEEALVRYKIALVNAIVRQAKNSEKAYICLKTSWVLRGMREMIDQNTPENEKKKAELLLQEKEYQKNAMEGFIAARGNELPPIAGMNEVAADYLIAVLLVQFERYADAAKLVQGVLGSNKATANQKDKARVLIGEIKNALSK